MRLRTQLLFVSLLTLALPWAGCQYVREFETALRQNQQNSLSDSASSIAAVLAENPALLVRDPVQLVSVAEPASAIYAKRLSSLMTLDGFSDDWNLRTDDFQTLTGAVEARFVAGIDDANSWLFIEVTDDDLRYETPDNDVRDHILIDYESPAGITGQLLIATAARGRSGVRRREGGLWINEARAQTVWEETAQGYQVELRIRNSIIGARIGISVFDASTNRTELRQSSTFATTRPGMLVHRLPKLEQAIQDFQFGTRAITISDAQGWVIAATNGTEAAPGSDNRSYPLAEKLLRRIIQPAREPDPLRGRRGDRLNSDEVISALAGEAETRWYRAADERSAVVVATHPIVSNNTLRGVVVLEQTSEAILTLTDRALARLIFLTFFATLVAALGLLGFATYLSIRIQRLSRAAQQAVSPDGSITVAMPGSRAADELGDLSRNFAGLLGRLQEHTDYLRSLAGKLSHELRTPLAVVQSSLDNLDAADLPADAKVYAVRAREGSQRLRSILTAMSEASRVEQAIAHAEVESFDLRDLVEGCVNGYRDVHPSQDWSLSLPESECNVSAVPELIAQMLDKLIDNAAGFSPEGGRIAITLIRHAADCQLHVDNEGPPLPEQMQSQIFDSMVSVRERKGSEPHLGFGLHIARLIAESHDGAIACSNLATGDGARFTISLPLSRDPGAVE